MVVPPRNEDSPTGGAERSGPQAGSEAGGAEDVSTHRRHKAFALKLESPCQIQANRTRDPHISWARGRAWPDCRGLTCSRRH